MPVKASRKNEHGFISKEWVFFTSSCALKSKYSCSLACESKLVLPIA